VKDIILRIIEELVTKILQKIEEGGLSDIDQFSSESLELCKASIRELISEIVNRLNEELRSNKKFRREIGLSLKEKDRERSIFNDVGYINIKRDYYYDKKSKGYIYPIDLMLGITPYERVGSNVSARLVMQAAEVSYEKSAAIVTGGEVSKQTVKNKIVTVGSLEKEAPVEKRVVKELHVFADECHAPLQEGRNRVVPLITISEGVQAIGGRKGLINPVHFTAPIKRTKEAWENVGGYVSRAYDESQIERIYLHGDGASWIKQGVDELPNCKFVIDSFHFEKHLKQATAAFSKQNYRLRIRQAIIEKDKGKAIRLVNEMVTLSEEPKRAKSIRKFRSYLLNNWEGITRRYTEGIIGSCTEALVSHVYSERLSRNPMGWSDEGLHKMAELRVYTRNGCVVTAKDFKRTKQEKERSIFKEYAQERIREAIDGYLDWSIFEKEQYNLPTNSPTQILIRSYGRLRSLVG